MKKSQPKSKPFSKLSKSEKRVVIAKDVIQQIKVGKYLAETGGYIDGIFFKKQDKMDSSKMEDMDIKKNFGKIRQCTVCAMGACLMSITKFQNKLTFGDVGSGVSDMSNTKVTKLFKSLFSDIQLHLIEKAFEGTDTVTLSSELFGLDEDNFSEQVERCDRNFYSEYGTDSERLIAIMRNIIKNKGTFKP